MSDTGGARRRATAAYVCALACMTIAYPVLRLATGQPTLSVTLAIVAALAGYLIYRLVHLRGRVTLAMAVVGFPLLAAMLFTAFRYVSPFVERQRSYDQLNAAGIGFWGRRPEQIGEWTQDIEGNTLPTWLASRIGDDCMMELASIDGRLEDLQNFDRSRIDTSTLKYVNITWDDDSTELSPAFAKWLGGLNLHGIVVNHRLLPTDDIRATVASSTELIAGQFASKRWVPGGAGWNIHFDLETNAKLDSETVAELSRLPDQTQLTLTGVRMDAPALEILAKHQFASVTFQNVQLPRLARVTGRPHGELRELQILGGNLSIEEVRQLIRIFRCELFALASGASIEEIDSLWSQPFLKEVYLWGGGLGPRRVSRPTD